MTLPVDPAILYAAGLGFSYATLALVDGLYSGRVGKHLPADIIGPWFCLTLMWPAVAPFLAVYAVGLGIFALGTYLGRPRKPKPIPLEPKPPITIGEGAHRSVTVCPHCNGPLENP